MRLLTIGAMQQQANIHRAGIWLYKGLPFEYEEVTNPITGRTWMDRNLGASQVATAFNDALAYGDLFQWGRLDDLHQNRGSGTTATLSPTDVPGHGNFILSAGDWLVTRNDLLWQSPGLTNVPAPPGFSVPSLTEWEAEMDSWPAINYTEGFNSVLKLTTAGRRRNTDGVLIAAGGAGYYWSSTIRDNRIRATHLFVASGGADFSIVRAFGYTVRLIKEL